MNRHAVNRSARWVLVAAAALAGVLTADIARAELAILSPDAGTVQVARTTGGETQGMVYHVERSGATVKYEDASTGLGENRRVETDMFVIRVREGGDSVTVTTKAGRGIATSISGLGDEKLDDNGFRIRLASIVDESPDVRVYTLEVTSESNTRALSHIEFTFVAGQRAQGSYD